MSQLPKLELVLTLCIFSQITLYAENSLIVETKSGKVRGKKINVEEKKVKVFYGIPYAKSPVGNLRFRHPVPIESWDDILDATEKPYSCWQVKDDLFGNFSGSNMWNPNTEMNEDCLKLNIWVPDENLAEPFAVMVWIFGGGFTSGTATLDVYNSEILASKGNVIIVSLNYRVGALGFLYFGRKDAPGNAGMFDQVMALEWIRDNIRYFNGDPNRITLFGESAGAASISLLHISHISRHLYHRIILQSGSATSSWAMMSANKLKANGFKLAKQLGCPHKNKQLNALMDCLREKNASDVIKTLDTTSVLELIEFPFVPVVDGLFLNRTPSEYISQGDFKKCPTIAGSNRDEGSYFLLYGLPGIFHKEEVIHISQNNFSEIIAQSFPHTSPLIRSTLEFQYKDWLNFDDDKVIDSLDKVIGDKYFTCPVNLVLKALAKYHVQNVYSYYFAHRSSNNFWPQWMGVIHGDEIPYVFGEPFFPGKDYRNEEKELSNSMIIYWTNFAKSGDVNSPENVGTIWPPYRIQEEKYLVLDTNKTVKAGLRTKFCAFWNDYLPQLESKTSIQPSCQSSKGRLTSLSHQIVIFYNLICVLIYTFCSS